MRKLKLKKYVFLSSLFSQILYNFSGLQNLMLNLSINN